jgi:hypothetical protein
MAAVCPACGVPPLADNKFCQNCGNETIPLATMCVKCGSALRQNSPVIVGGANPNAEVFAGLNQTGLILFIVLLLTCLPLCWLPWVIQSCKVR